MSNFFGNWAFFKFFFKHCIRDFVPTLLFLSFSSAYWAFDVQYRTWINKMIIETFEVVPKDSALSVMLPWIWMYAVCYFLRFAILRFSSYLMMYYSANLKISLLEYFFNETLVKANFLIKKDMDVLSNQIQEALNNFISISELVFRSFIAHLSLLIFSLIMFLKYPLLLYPLITLYFFFLLSAIVGYGYGINLSGQVLNVDLKIFARLNDIFSNLFNVKLLNSTKYEQKQLSPFYSEVFDISLKKDFWYLMVNGVLSFFFLLYHTFCLVFLTWLYQTGDISKSDFPYVLMINMGVTDALWSIVDDFDHISRSVGRAKASLNRIFSDTLSLAAPKDLIPVKSFDIVFSSVSFRYPDCPELLFEDLSLKIHNGSKIGIVGYSGSGKSSLASLLLNLSQLEAGSISIGGFDLNAFSFEQLYSLITFMNQNLSLFNRSIKENIFYGLPHASDAEIINAAKMANIHDFIESLPDKYETVVQFQGREFSYGQKQRILIARAFLRDTPILVLDEITSALDVKSENLIMDSLFKLMKGKTVIVIAHKLKTLAGMDYIVEMKNGQIVAVGTHEELLHKKSIYFDLSNGSV